jgi:hypothetical protein
MADDFYVSQRPKDEEIHTLFTVNKFVYMLYAVVSNNTESTEEMFDFYIAPRGKKYNKNTLYLRSNDLTAYDYDTILYLIPLFPGTRIGIKSYHPNALTFTIWGRSDII